MKRLCSLPKAAICYKALTQLFCEPCGGHASQSGSEDREQLAVLEPHMDTKETELSLGLRKTNTPSCKQSSCEARVSAGGQHRSLERAGAHVMLGSACKHWQPHPALCSKHFCYEHTVSTSASRNPPLVGMS